MKNFKILLLLAMMHFLSACGTSTSEFVGPCEDSAAPKEEAAGKTGGFQMFQRTVTLYFGKITKDETKSISSCSFSCLPGFQLESLEISAFSKDNPSAASKLKNSSDRNVCVPKTIPCPEGGSASFLGIDLSRVFGEPPAEALYSGLEAATYGECSQNNEEPSGCLEGYVAVGEDCLPLQASCTEEELTSIGAATGHKVFNTFTNEYDLCQADSCLPDYTLGLGICNPDIGGGDGPQDIYGCMDSRAANYDAAANVDDMSCVCDFDVIYNPIMGCANP